MRLSTSLRIFFTLTTLFTSASLHALVIRDYDPTIHDRFTSGWYTSPVVNSSWLGSPYDFSGVGWADDNANRGLTLISPQHLIGAWHYKPDLSESNTVHFLNANGQLKTYTIESLTRVQSGGIDTDLMIATLSAPINVADHIAYYPILELPQESDYLGLDLYLYGKGDVSPRLGTGQIDAFETRSNGGSTGRVLRWDELKLTGDPDEAHVEVGDSGSPAFTVTGGQLNLVGIHWLEGETPTHYYTFSSFVPAYINEIEAIQAAIPEPSHMALLLGLGCVIALCRCHYRGSV